jgi:hypothetical protein
MLPAFSSQRRCSRECLAGFLQSYGLLMPTRCRSYFRLPDWLHDELQAKLNLVCLAGFLQSYSLLMPTLCRSYFRLPD